MNVYIPLATGQTLLKEAVDSLRIQTINCDIVPCASPGEVNSEHNYTSARIKGEIVSRNMCIDAFLKTTDKYFITQSRDIIHLQPNNIEKMIAFMDINKTFGGCILKCLGSCVEHFVFSAACISRSAIEKGFSFVNRYGWCPCKEVAEDLKKLGYDYGHVSEDVLVLNGRGR